ncbi:MAG: HAMP domain-containing protein [Anaerolineae bacterium]|nr:HAMP domain-containing protein [Anaerolineae bacterium]
MNYREILRDPLFRRMFKLFLIFEFVPTLVVTALPIMYWMGISERTDFTPTLFVLWAIEFVSLMLVSGFIAWYVARPLFSLMKGIQAVGAGNLGYRATCDGGDNELVALITTFNAMAETIETSHNRLERQRADLQTTLKAREREFDVILQIVNLVNNQDDLVRKAERALKIAQPALGSDIIALALLDNAKQVNSVVFACNNCNEPRCACCDSCSRQRLIHQCLHVLQDTHIRETVQNQEKFRLFTTMDQDLDPTLKNLLDQLGMRKMALKPLIARGRVQGILVLMRYAVEPIPSRSTTLLETLSENIAVLIENWKLQAKARELTVMQERRHMARELHDSVTQSLFTLSLTAQGLRSTLQGVPGIDQQALIMLAEQTRIIQNEMRTLINELRPVDLEAADLGQALRQHVDSLRYSANIHALVAIRGHIQRIPVPIQQQLNRIAQEALSNVARHSKASQAQLSLDTDEDTVLLTIRDNGIGFNPSDFAIRSDDSLGLTSMRERCEMMGGKLLVHSSFQQGTVITVKIPITRETEATYA